MSRLKTFLRIWLRPLFTYGGIRTEDRSCSGTYRI